MVPCDPAKKNASSLLWPLPIGRSLAWPARNVFIAVRYLFVLGTGGGLVSHVGVVGFSLDPGNPSCLVPRNVSPPATEDLCVLWG